MWEEKWMSFQQLCIKQKCDHTSRVVSFSMNSFCNNAVFNNLSNFLTTDLLTVRDLSMNSSGYREGRYLRTPRETKKNNLSGWYIIQYLPSEHGNKLLSRLSRRVCLKRSCISLEEMKQTMVVPLYVFLLFFSLEFGSNGPSPVTALPLQWELRVELSLKPTVVLWTNSQSSDWFPSAQSFHCPFGSFENFFEEHFRSLATQQA